MTFVRPLRKKKERRKREEGKGENEERRTGGSVLIVWVCSVDSSITRITEC